MITNIRSTIRHYQYHFWRIKNEKEDKEIDASIVQRSFRRVHAWNTCNTAFVGSTKSSGLNGLTCWTLMCYEINKTQKHTSIKFWTKIFFYIVLTMFQKKITNKLTIRYLIIFGLNRLFLNTRRWKEISIPLKLNIIPPFHKTIQK